MASEVPDTTNANRLRGKKKKKLFLKIRDQMEFYFSDSNLAKDKFLQKLVKEDSEGYVNLEVFKTFNKIEDLTEDVHIIAAAVSKSEKLELNADKTKIRRSSPLGEPKDFDACTLYVEKLPPHADHSWIKDVFEHFGTVDYVNIPRFKTSNKIKGFAFIEFNNPESVAKACEYYKNLLLKEASKLEGNAESKSEGSKKIRHRSSHRDSTEHGVDKRKRKCSSDLESTSKKKREDRNLNDCDKKVKCRSHDRKRKAEPESSAVAPKKPKKTESDVEHQLSSDHNEDSDVLVDQQQPSAADPSSSVVEVSEGEDHSKSKRKRKHRKRHQSERPQRPLLRVMSKFEWKAYRNKYLSLQRTTMSHLKKQILLEMHQLREQEAAKTEEPQKKGFHVGPGVLLHVSLSDSISEPSSIKEKVKAAASVAYVDAKPGHSEVFIRCHNTDDAQAIVKEEKLKGVGEVRLLEGDEEAAYITKIEEDRKAKFSVPLTHKKRGRDKLFAKATKLEEQKNKHIYFDE